MKKLDAILQYARAHKIISIIVIVVLLGGGYYWYSVANTAPTVTKYVVEDATTGTIVSSVSPTGQVQACRRLDGVSRYSSSEMERWGARSETSGKEIAR